MLFMITGTFLFGSKNNQGMNQTLVLKISYKWTLCNSRTVFICTVSQMSRSLVEHIKSRTQIQPAFSQLMHKCALSGPHQPWSLKPTKPAGELCSELGTFKREHSSPTWYTDSTDSATGEHAVVSYCQHIFPLQSIKLDFYYNNKVSVISIYLWMGPVACIQHCWTNEPITWNRTRAYRLCGAKGRTHGPLRRKWLPLTLSPDKPAMMHLCSLPRFPAVNMRAALWPPGGARRFIRPHVSNLIAGHVWKRITVTGD